ncbi:hypothetical protein JDV09_18440 [Mycobacterium sp. Y57]|nr:hypothetical protein [Mycolicibacterium xanthum]
MSMDSTPDPSELLSARRTSPSEDDVAWVILGPRLGGLCAALGAPVRDWHQISRWVDHADDFRTWDAVGSYVDVLIADRCHRPGGDLISGLIAHEVDGRGLTADEIREVLTGLIVKGTI